MLADVRADALLFREEVFGSEAGFVRFADEAETIALANGPLTGLAAHLSTRDIDRVWRVLEAMEMVGLNPGLISTEVSPFGEVNQSGVVHEGLPP